MKELVFGSLLSYSHAIFIYLYELGSMGVIGCTAAHYIVKDEFTRHRKIL